MHKLLPALGLCALLVVACDDYSNNQPSWDSNPPPQAQEVPVVPAGGAEPEGVDPGEAARESSSINPKWQTRFEPGAPEAEMGSLVLVNEFEDRELWYLYVSPSGSTERGNDQLGSDVVPPGGRYTLHSIPAGYYDLSLEDSTGEVYQQWGVWIGGESVWRFYYED